MPPLEIFEDAGQTAHHRFEEVAYNGDAWDLTHLDSFVFKDDLEQVGEITVLVLFSCHCFSHSLARDVRAPAEIPRGEIYDDGREQRVLNQQRYELSRKFLRNIVMDLPERHILRTVDGKHSFLTCEDVADDGTVSLYAVFFEVETDTSRKRRLILRIQSAYVLDGGLTKRQASAKKVRFKTLLRTTFQGKQIKR